MKKLFVDIILPLPLPQLFTYSIPEYLQKTCLVGVRVVVPFGARKQYSGIVRKIHAQAPTRYQTKPIVTVLDSKPIIYENIFRFWEWIASYYLCSIGEVYKAALPAGLKLESETQISYQADFEADTKLSPKEIQILSLLEAKNEQSIKELSSGLKQKNILPQLNSLLEKRAVSIKESLRRGYKPKLESFILLNPQIADLKALNDIFSDLKRAKQQAKLLIDYIQFCTKIGKGKRDKDFFASEIKKAEIANTTNQNSALKQLVKKGIFTVKKKQVNRLIPVSYTLKKQSKLSQAQQTALQQIKEQFESKNVVLLHGVTSSGKTEIYIKLMQEQLQKGKQVLYLLPEIALTSQIISRLRQIFGKKIGVYHSKFSDSERVEIWNGINKKENAYQIILGVRSSIFLPFNKLGLIIIDEEHENTFKQHQPAPRYNARDASIVLAQIHGAKTLLGTATPAIESYFNARQKKYGLVELTERYAGIQMPQILTANLAEARRKRQMKSHFSPLLLQEIEATLQKKEQLILFQNRRGYSPYLECHTCGWIPKCEHCDVSLTYHRYHNHLSCHYCGYQIEMPRKCLACEGNELKTRGFGTEKIESEIAELFPDARIARMDLDSTRSKGAYQRIISQFETGAIDILIGTQMVTKGLDFERVNLVGILNADNMLNFPDFRAFERSYQLMAQVSGRAGRKKQGKVIIQTINPQHAIIQQVIRNDYFSFYMEQLKERKGYDYPPFFKLILISLKHKDLNKLDHAAQQLAKSMYGSFGKQVLGPEYPLVSRIQNSYIKNIILKVERKYKVSAAKEVLQKLIEQLKGEPAYKSVYITINVDPL